MDKLAAAVATTRSLGIPDRAHVELIDTRWIEPLVSEKAVAGYDEMLRPVLACKPLEQGENNYAEALLL